MQQHKYHVKKKHKYIIKSNGVLVTFKKNIHCFRFIKMKTQKLLQIKSSFGYLLQKKKIIFFLMANQSSF